MNTTARAPERAQEPRETTQRPNGRGWPKGKPRKAPDAPPSPPSARALEIARLYQEGAKPKDIIARYGITRQRLFQILRRAGVDVRPLPGEAVIDLALDLARYGQEQRGLILAKARHILVGQGYRVGVARVRERLTARWGRRLNIPPHGTPDTHRKCCTCGDWFAPEDMTGPVCREDHNARMRAYFANKRQEAGNTTPTRRQVEMGEGWAEQRQQVLELVEQHGVEWVATFLGRSVGVVKRLATQARREREGAA